MRIGRSGGDPVSVADRAFVAKASQGGMFEVKAGEVAADRGGPPDIKDQGFTEAHDHKLVGDKLKTIHAKDGAAFAVKASSGADPKLRAFAAETHRIGERHIGEQAIGAGGR